MVHCAYLTRLVYGSRPTAVNLSDAVEKLRSLVLKTVETATEAKTVFQVGYISCIFEVPYYDSLV